MIVEDKFYVGYRDVDTNLKIKNSAILNLFEDIAGIHAAKVGEGATKTGTTWLLIGYKVKVFKRPVHGQKVNVITWGTEIKGITAAREFEIRSIDDDKINIHTFQNFSYNGSGLGNTKRDFVIEAGESLRLTTPTIP